LTFYFFNYKKSPTKLTIAAVKKRMFPPAASGMNLIRSPILANTIPENIHIARII
jgi:hypothetical protein